MNKREIAILAFKVLAVYFALGSFGSIESLISNWYLFQPEQRTQMISFHLLPAGISVGIGVLLWMSSESIASRVFSNFSSETNAPTIQRPPEEILEIAFAIIGLWLVVHSFPSVINSIALYIFSLRGEQSLMGGTIPLTPEQNRQLFDIRAKASIVSNLIELLIGLVLLVGTRSSVNLLKRIRNTFLFTPVRAAEDREEGTETDST